MTLLKKVPIQLIRLCLTLHLTDANGPIQMQFDIPDFTAAKLEEILSFIKNMVLKGITGTVEVVSVTPPFAEK